MEMGLDGWRIDDLMPSYDSDRFPTVVNSPQSKRSHLKHPHSMGEKEQEEDPAVRMWTKERGKTEGSKGAQAFMDATETLRSYLGESRASNNW